MKLNGKTVKVEVGSTFCERTNLELKDACLSASLENEGRGISDETSANLKRLGDSVNVFHLIFRTDSGTEYRHKYQLSARYENVSIYDRTPAVNSENQEILEKLAERVNASDKEADLDHWFVNCYIYGTRDWQRYGERELMEFERQQEEDRLWYGNPKPYLHQIL